MENKIEEIVKLGEKTGKQIALKSLLLWFEEHQEDAPEDFRKAFYQRFVKSDNPFPGND